jgi:hypothetical protein
MELPRMLVYSAVIYVFVLIYGMNFIMSSVAFGLFAWDFLLIALIILLPVPFFIMYLECGRLPVLYGRGPLLLKIAFTTTVVAAVFVVFFIVPLSY